MQHTEKTLTDTEIYNGPIFRVRRYTIELEDGSTAGREVVYHDGGSCIVAFNERNELMLVRQFRFPLQAETLELPAGKLEKGEDPRLAAVRELEEETGYHADRMELMVVNNPSPGYCRETLYIYRADGLHRTHQHLDKGEFLSIESVPLEKAVEMVLSGIITDGKTQVGILTEYARRVKLTGANKSEEINL